MHPGDSLRDVPESKVREALDRIRTLVVDYNELRVVPPFELAEMVGDYPDVRLKCEDISRALNKIFALHHSVSLDHLTGMSRKDVVAYLDALDGLEDYTRARIRLLALQQHAVPLDEAMWAYARYREVIDHRCPLGEAQAFLERQIAEGEALEFYTLLNRQAWAECGTAVRAARRCASSAFRPIARRATCFRLSACCPTSWSRCWLTKILSPSSTKSRKPKKAARRAPRCRAPRPPGASQTTRAPAPAKAAEEAERQRQPSAPLLPN